MTHVCFYFALILIHSPWHKNGLHLHQRLLRPVIQVQDRLCPSQPPSNKTLPLIDGHVGHDLRKGDMEPVRSITHLLDHVELHVRTLSQIVYLSSSSSEPQDGSPSCFATIPPSPPTLGGVEGSVHVVDYVEVYVEVDQLPHLPPSPRGPLCMIHKQVLHCFG